MEFSHKPVLLDETIAALQIRPQGIYVDGTAGGAGHSSAIARQLAGGRLIALDRDPDAVKVATERLAPYNATVVQSNYSQMDAVLQSLGISAVDGVLMDLGVSSWQLDNKERGFSYQADAPLDMRMSQSGPTAADLVNTMQLQELTDIFRLYGEEKFAFKIAKNIVQARQQSPITTTLQLAELIKDSVPAAARRDGHPARKCFQALRIAVNGELDGLEQGIDAAFSVLKPGGILAIITFHSLEDRIVKQHFAKLCTGCECPPDFPVCVCHKTPKAKTVFKKTVAPSAAEQEENPRSRSAKLRAIQKI